MSAMKAFYGKTLDLRLMDERAGSVHGRSRRNQDHIRRRARTPSTAARRSITSRSTSPRTRSCRRSSGRRRGRRCCAIPERNRAAGYPPDVVDYRHWNAHSVFFLDPAGNVVEYIARHDLKNGDTAPFSWADILYVSEIGLVVDDVAAAAAGDQDDGGASSPYKGGSGEFMAMGDEYGLVLVMKRGRVIDFTGNAGNGVRVYRTSVNLRGAKAARHERKGYPVQDQYRRTVFLRVDCVHDPPVELGDAVELAKDFAALRRSKPL